MKWLVLTLSYLWAGTLITKPVAQVGNPAFAQHGQAIHFISLREVHLHHLVVHAARGEAGPLTLLALESPQFAAEIVETLKDWVVFLDTENFNAIDIGTGERDQLRARAATLLARSPSFKSMGFSEKELHDCIFRHLKAQVFIQFKRKSGAGVSDAEALNYYNDNARRMQLGAGSFIELKDKIKQVLNREMIEQRTTEWYQGLIRKYNARSYVQDL